MRYIKFIIIGIGFLGLFLGCDKLPFFQPKKETKQTPSSTTTVPVKGPIAAQVNNIIITLDDLEQEINSYNTLVSDRPELKITTRERKLDYLKNEIIRRALLYQEALDRGLDRDENVLRALEKAKMELLVMELVRREAEKVEVSSKEIEDYYNTYKEQLKEPEERRIREIIVPTETEAKEVLIQLLQGADFAELAKQRSRSSSAKEGGDLGYLSPGKKFVQFDTVAFSTGLDKGQISNIFKGPEGYYILKVEDIKGGRQKSLTEMWEDIKRGLLFLKQQQRIEELVSKISSSGKVKINIFEENIK